MSEAPAQLPSGYFWTCQPFINGEFLAGDGELGVENPATEEIFTTVETSSRNQTIDAIAAARKAFDEGSWSGLPSSERAKALSRLMQYLAGQRENLIETIVLEAGCPRGMGVMAAQVDAGLHHGMQIMDLFQSLPEFQENPVPINERINPMGSVVQSLRQYVPIGVVAAITPYNFPFYVNIWKVIPALMAGNTVVLRPSPLTPLSAMIFGEAAQAADLPPGVLNVVVEDGAEGAIELSAHPDVNMVTFTGSSQIGSQVMAQAAPTLKRLQLELGGKSAQIFMPDSLDGAVMAPLGACLSHAGQACVLGSRILVPQAEKPALLEKMKAALQSIVIGDPSDVNTQMGPVISAAQRDRCEHFVRLATEAGGTVVAGGNRPAHLERGYYFEPTILDLPDNSNPAAQEEIFGPVVGVIGYEDLDHAVEIANDTVYGLSGYVIGKDKQQALQIAQRMRTGTVNINGGMASAYASSGGHGMSGLGRERGIEGMRVYQEIRCLNIGC